MLTADTLLYLRDNVIGLCSGFQYGSQGDQVEVIDKSRPLWLVTNGATKFFIHPEKLTDVRIEDPVINKETPGDERVVRNKAAPNKYKRNPRPIMPETGQGSLY